MSLKKGNTWLETERSRCFLLDEKTAQAKLIQASMEPIDTDELQELSKHILDCALKFVLNNNVWRLWHKVQCHASQTRARYTGSNRSSQKRWYDSRGPNRNPATMLSLWTTSHPSEKTQSVLDKQKWKRMTQRQMCIPPQWSIL